MIKTDCFKPYANLAKEYCLLDYIDKKTEEGKDLAALMLWQNDRTIVIGRNQNPINECDLNQVRMDGVKIARRLTGGGAVYHDLGNLNFSFVLSKSLYDPKTTTNVIISALKRLGVAANVSGRNDILLNGEKKISGNAYYSKEHAGLHHGTLLLSGAANDYAKYLMPNLDKMNARGVKSVRSRIGFLSDAYPEITLQNLKTEIERQFRSAFTAFLISEKWEPDPLLFQETKGWLQSQQWIMGDYIDCKESAAEVFSWGVCRVGKRMEDGRVYWDLESDTLEQGIIEEIKSAVQGKALNAQALETIFVDLTAAQNRLKKDILYDIYQIFKKLI